MPVKKAKKTVDPLLEAVKEALLDKKAKEPVSLDFNKSGSSLCDYFIICHGTSSTQVTALADGVMRDVKKKTGLNPYHREGFENAEWILIDYGDIIVHIFQESKRNFYNLEQLWADAVMMKLDSAPEK